MLLGLQHVKGIILVKAGSGGTYLESQHSGAKAKRIMSSRLAYTT